MSSTSSADATTSEGGSTFPTLRVRALECRRGDRRLFAGLDLEVQPGQVVWIRGANGRGKTSLLRLLAGLSRPERGEILWVDESPETPAERRATAKPAGSALGGSVVVPGDRGAHSSRLVYIGHSNALKEDLTVQESLRFLARLHGRAASDAALDDALRRCGVIGRRDAAVRTLSQGQRRRVTLARLALEAAPSLWILDEPFDALDTQGVATLNDLLAAHARRGGSVVLTSHLPLTLPDPEPITVSLDNAAA